MELHLKDFVFQRFFMGISNFLLSAVYLSMVHSSISWALHLHYMTELTGKEPNNFNQL